MGLYYKYMRLFLFIHFFFLWGTGAVKTRYENIVLRVYLFSILERLHHRPVFTEAPQNLTLVSGSSGALTCKVLSDLHPYIGWYIGESTVDNTDIINITNMVKVEVCLERKHGAFQI